MNKRTYDMRISSRSKGLKLEYNNQTYDLPAKINVERSDKPLELSVYNDTISKKLQVQASHHPYFVYGNIGMPVYGHAIDLTNNNRYYYGKSLLIDINDTTSIIPTGFKPLYKRPLHKGVVNIILSMPYVNNFHLHPPAEGIKSNTGFMGIATGVEYIYRQDHFLRLTTGACTDFFLPAPAPVDYFSGEVNDLFSVYASVTNNVRLYAFTFGYGLHFSENTWRYHFYGPDVPSGVITHKVSTTHSLGFVGNAYCRMGKYFHLGVIYQPSVYRSSPSPQFHYEHVISLDLLWKIALQKDKPLSGHFSGL